MDSTRTLDVVIPVYNEAPGLPRLFESLGSAFSPDRLREANIQGVRFLLVDDGSTDDTAALIADRIRADWPAALLCLSRNFGHQASVTAGLDSTTASFVAVMDGDLQDPPELVLEMIQRLDAGFDVVYGQRASRQESFFKKFLYWSFYRLVNLLADVPTPLDAGDFCVMRSEVVKALRTLQEKLRFHRGLRSWVGFRQCAFPFDRPARRAGVSKYSWRALYSLATDGIIAVSIRPLRIMQVFVFLSALAAVAYLGVTTFLYRHSMGGDSHRVWFLMTQGLIAFTSSVQLFCLYILGAYIGRMYIEVKSRPSYIIVRTIEAPSSSVK